MKQIEGPDVDGAAGKVDTGWSGRFNNHYGYSNWLTVDLRLEIEILNLKFEIDSLVATRVMLRRA
jgi:hypothetical protein